MKQVSWQRAWAISLVFHLVLLGGLGWFGADLFIQRESADVMEVDLFAGDPGPGGGGGAGGGPGGGQGGGANRAVPAAMTTAAGPGQVAVSEPMLIDGVAAPAAGDVAASAGVTAGNGNYTNAGGNGTGGYGTGTGGAGYGAGGPGYGGGGAGYGNSGGGSTAPRQLQPPRILKKVDPRYPEQARQQGIEGTVQLRIEILENGRPGEIEVAASSGDDRLDAAAVSAVERWRFVPARDVATGAAVRCYTTMPVAFRLE